MRSLKLRTAAIILQFCYLDFSLAFEMTIRPVLSFRQNAFMSDGKSRSTLKSVSPSSYMYML